MVDVLFFADLRDKVGHEKLSFDTSGITVKELKDQWLKSYDLENLDNAMIAINEEYVEEDAILNTGDTVAFIPPVSGG